MQGAKDAVRALGGAGLVAVSRCGHWWPRPFRMTTERMHGVARFNRMPPCPFCLSEWQARANAQARPPSRRVN